MRPFARIRITDQSIAPCPGIWLYNLEVIKGAFPMQQKTEYIYLPEVGSILSEYTIPVNLIIPFIFTAALCFALFPIWIVYCIVLQIRCILNPDLAKELTTEAALKRIENGEPPIL